VLDVDTFSEAGEKIFSNVYTLFIRGLGNFGGPAGPATKERAVAVPARAPDAVQEDSTDLSQALLYRLSGDTNPLHADPAMAAIGGFKKPILHGLCTFGYAGRAVLRHFCDNDATRLKQIKVRRGCT
jgi:3-hydroxyacyl-CoA dehydrogenase/3a,7a,12a-trihydroxy-5b-cholest-24-enoyl-CoA hydratase